MSPLLLWQLADSAFPSGGFTHSGGFEAAVQHGDARTIDDVDRLVRASVRQAGRGTLPFAVAAHHDREQLPGLDARIDLFLNQPVSNRASRAQGLALINTAARVFHTSSVLALADCVAARRLAGHHAPIFGALMGALGVDLDTASQLFLYQTARSVISAATRLGVIGMFDGQRLQQHAAGEIQRTLDVCRGIAPEDAAQVAPLLDLYQSTQDRLYSRLFQS